MFSFIVGECVAFVLHVCQVLWLDFDPVTMYFDRFFFVIFLIFSRKVQG